MSSTLIPQKPRSTRQRSPKALGDSFEARLQTQHDIYALTGTCYVVAVPPAIVIEQRLPKGKIIGRIKGKGPPDYSAIVRGQAVVFDAKSTVAKSWDFDGLAEHQAEHFDRAQAAGGYSFVLLSMSGRVWLLPWLDLGALWWAWWKTPGRAKAGTASLSAADLARIGHRCQGADWAPVAARLIGGAP